MRRLGIAFAVALAIGGLAASAAAEPPEYGRCVKVAKGTGAYKAGCTIALAGGTYEWVAGTGPSPGFTLTNGTTVAVFETTTDYKTTTCTGISGAGRYSGSKTVGSLNVSLTGCTAQVGRLNCTSAGQPPGTIVPATLEGELGIVTKGETAAKDKIGLDLFPVGREGLIAEYTCAGLIQRARGSLIVPVHTNKMVSSSTVKVVGRHGHQKPERFEGGPIDVLEWSENTNPFEQAALTVELTTTGEEPIEVNSVL